MSCILCRLRWRSDAESAPAIRPASYIVFGLGVCAIHSDPLVDALIDGASVRDILKEAQDGDW